MSGPTAGFRSVRLDLQAQLASFNTSDFEAIANKGLVRRASKDLQTLTPSVLEETEVTLRVAIADAEVTLSNQGFMESTCTCIATEFCRHRLMVGLWLKATADPKEPMAAVEPSWQWLLACDRAQLVQWAGKKTVQQAVDLVLEGQIGDVEGAATLTVRFGGLNITCHLLPHTTLEAMVCSCKSKTVCVHRVAAVFSYQKSQGMPLLQEAPTPLTASSGTPRTRQQVLASVQTLFEEMLRIGLSHGSITIQQRLETLAISAIGVNLPRLARLLKSLSTQVQHLRQRDANADSEQFLGRLIHAYGLSWAIAHAGDQAHPDWVGWHRSQYDQVGHLDLVGVGAYPWQTASGYTGLTVLFWERATQQWQSWSVARPATVGFSPQLAYRQALLWNNTLSPQQAACSRIGLLNARRNREDRLSNSTQTQAMLLGPINPMDLDFGPRAIRTWHPLQHYVQSIQGTGLRIRRPLETLVVVYPHQWGDRQFNELQQCFYWTLIDTEGQTIPLKVPFNAMDEPRIRQLESLNTEHLEGAGLIARVEFSYKSLGLYPLSILYQEEILSLGWLSDTIQPPPPQPPEQSISPDSTHGEENGDELDSTDRFEYPLTQANDLEESALQQTLTKLQDRLCAIAEQGLPSITPSVRQELQSFVHILQTSGVTTLSHLLEQLLTAQNSEMPKAFFKTAYILYSVRH